MHRKTFLVNFGADYEKEEERLEFPREPENYELQEGEVRSVNGSVLLPNPLGDTGLFAEEKYKFGNAISSLTDMQTAEGKPLHMPAIDIDFPVIAIPSKTDGHTHLYIEKAITWPQYMALLLAMANAGIVEDGYVAVCMQRRASYLRITEGTPR